MAENGSLKAEMESYENNSKRIVKIVQKLTGITRKKLSLS